MPSNTPVRPAPQLKQPRNPVSLKQVDAVLSRAAAGGSLVFAAQTIGPFLAQKSEGDPIWEGIVGVAIPLSLFVALTFSIIGRYWRQGHGAVAFIYLIALVTWPFTIITPHSGANSHWLYFLVTVGTATAAIAFPLRWAVIYLLVIPTLYGLIRMTHNGGSEPVLHAILDSIYSIILGGAVVIIVAMLRQTATNVDFAQTAALDRYGHAVRQHATEVERVQVDAIVHDSVLTTLISAARAFSPESRELAAVMAGNAIGHLHDAALVQPDDGTTVRLRAMAKRVTDAAATMSPVFVIRSSEVSSRAIPITAAEAVYSAAVQAMVNSTQHAGTDPSIERWVSMRSVRPGGVEIKIGDTGKGFASDDVPTERIGVRVSIIERVQNAGGLATIQSKPNQGTVVTVRWPAPARSGQDSSVAIPAELRVDEEAKR